MLDKNTTDFLNPVIYKELRQILTGFSIFKVFMVIFAIVEVFLGCLYFFADLSADDSHNLAVLHGLVTYACIAVSGLLVVANTGRERLVDGLDPLLGTRITPLTVVRGKVDAALILNAVPLLISVPLSLIFWKYVQILPFIVTLFGILAMQMWSLAIACYKFNNSANAQLLWVIPAGIGSIFCFVIAGIAHNHQVFNFFENFWMPLVSLLTTIAGGACFAVSMLRHDRQNRMLPFRVFTLAGPVITLLVLVLLYRCCENDPEALGVFIFDLCSCFILITSLFFAGGTFENMHPTRRMRRELPENPLLKSLSLPFLSGAAPAMLNALIMIGLCFAVTGNLQDGRPLITVFAINVLFYSSIIMFIRSIFKKVSVLLLWMVLGVVSLLMSIAAVALDIDILLMYSVGVIAEKELMEDFLILYMPLLFVIALSVGGCIVQYAYRCFAAPDKDQL